MRWCRRVSIRMAAGSNSLRRSKRSFGEHDAVERRSASSTMARMAPRPCAEMISAVCTTSSARRCPRRSCSPMNDVPARAGTRSSARPGGRSSGRPSTNTQIVRSARRKKPTPPSRRVASATSEPLSTSSPDRPGRPAPGVSRSQAVALQLGAGVAVAVDDEHRALAVEEQRVPAWPTRRSAG